MGLELSMAEFFLVFERNRSIPLHKGSNLSFR